MTKQRIYLVLGVLTLCFVCAAAQSQNDCNRTKGFSVASISGAYGITYSGTVLNASGFNSAIAATGRMVADGQGNLSGSETFNVVGKVCEGTLNGTYTVNGDGTASITLTFAPLNVGCPSGTTTLSAVLVDDGEEVYFSQNDNKVLSGVARKRVTRRSDTD